MKKYEWRGYFENRKRGRKREIIKTEPDWGGRKEKENTIFGENAEMQILKILKKKREKKNMENRKTEI